MAWQPLVLAKGHLDWAGAMTSISFWKIPRQFLKAWKRDSWPDNESNLDSLLVSEKKICTRSSWIAENSPLNYLWPSLLTLHPKTQAAIILFFRKVRNEGTTHIWIFCG